MLSDFRMTSDVKYLNLSMELYNKALDNDPDFIRAILGKAQIFLRNVNPDSALFYIEKAQKIDPEFPDGYFLKGVYYENQGQEVKAFNNFSKALKMEPNDWQVNFRLGDILIRQRNDIINGLAYIQKAYNLSTEDRDQMYLSIGRCYFHIGDLDKADYYFSKALELNVGCTIIMWYGWLYNNKGEFQQAMDFYDSICSSMDCNLLCYFQRFYTHLYLGNYDLSLENYNKAVDSGRDPSGNDLVTLACVYKGLGREAEANIIVEEYRIQLEEFQSPHSYFLLASIYALQNDKEKAIEYLLKYEEHGYTIWFNEITFYPAFEKLWKEPEFEAIVTRVENEKATLRKAIRQLEDSGEITF